MTLDYKISCLINMKCVLGEGPVWHEHLNTLFWVDIIERKIFSYNLTTTLVEWWQTDEFVGFIVFGSQGEMLAGYKSGLHKIELLPNHCVKSERIDRIDATNSSIRFNDGIIDQNGGLWACSMDMDNKSGLGKYFYYGADFKRRIVLENFIVANGPAINMGNDKLFTVETVGSPNRVKGVYRSSIIGEGSVYNEELFIPWVFDTYPDGVFTDNDDNVWVGEFGGNVVRKFSNEGELKLEIPLPAWNVTKGAFCKTQNRMFVTSARLQCNEEILERYPQTGGILMVEGLVHC